MTTLEVVDSPESQAAVGYLLNLVMKRLDFNRLLSPKQKHVNVKVI